MKADIFLSIRNKATRLPGKVLLQLKGKTLTEHLIDRLKNAKTISQIILCTSTNPSDDVLVEIAKNNNIEFFRGSEDDKLDRYMNASKKFSTDFIVVVDGDDIFCDPIFIDECVIEFKQTQADYITVKDLPVGITPFCIKKEALERVCKLKNEINTEVWGSYFTNTNLFNTVFIKVLNSKLRRPDIRLTLDYKEDFILIEKIFDKLYSPEKIISLEEIVNFLNNNPTLLKINQSVHELYLRNLEKAPAATLRTDNV